MKTRDPHQGQLVHGFRLERDESVPELRSRALLFRHEKSGARLLHLSNDDPDNLFAIAFRTSPRDNTGVAHILEHSVLCGSRKFPAKDPFQEMLKGSLQTFLNALTYPDKTVYPVSSQVEKDFYNLVDVYCDAVFHPRLAPHTFLQEGWHFALQKPEGEIDIKGIVYNEMKGVFSDFSSHVNRRSLSALFPDTTYRFESGGDPESIPDLDLEGLRRFHADYYHPSNAWIFLYGNLPGEKTLAFLDRGYLSEFEHKPLDTAIPLQPRWNAPRRLDIEAPAPREDKGTATTAMVWLLGRTADPHEVVCDSILSRYLLGSESSPLKRALVDSGLGEDLDDISGLETDLIQTTFAAGLRKSTPERAEEVESVIMNTLRAQCEGKIDSRLLEGARRRIEFRLREVTGSGGFPYHLGLASRAFRSWLYDGDPLAHLKFEDTLKRIPREPGELSAFFEERIRHDLVENRHRLLAVVRASPDKADRMQQRTRTHVKELTRDFTENDRIRVARETAELLKEQARPPSPEAVATLPRLHKKDLPRTNRLTPTERSTVEDVDVFAHPLFTSGIVYIDMGFDFSHVPSHRLPYLPLYIELLTRCGAGKLDYLGMSTRIARATGGISGSVHCESRADDASSVVGRCMVHARSLADRIDETLDILGDLFLAPRLDNHKQLTDLLHEMYNDLNASIVGAGHHFAMTHAASSLSPSCTIREQLSGIALLRFLHRLLKRTPVDEIVDVLRDIHANMIRRHGSVLSVTADEPPDYLERIGAFLERLPRGSVSAPAADTSGDQKPSATGIAISSSVNFVARARRLQNTDARAQGLYALLARHLSTGYLWDKIRVEGGAYGGIASFSTAHPVFHFASYRDPNLLDTLQRFEESLEETARGLDPDAVDQSIIGTIGRIDKPKTPHGRGYAETMALLAGRTEQWRLRLREGVLDAGVRELKNCAEALLADKGSGTTLLGSASALDGIDRRTIALTRETLVEQD